MEKTVGLPRIAIRGDKGTRSVALIPRFSRYLFRFSGKWESPRLAGTCERIAVEGKVVIRLMRLEAGGIGLEIEVEAGFSLCVGEKR